MSGFTHANAKLTIRRKLPSASTSEKKKQFFNVKLETRIAVCCTSVTECIDHTLETLHFFFN